MSEENIPDPFESIVADLKPTDSWELVSVLPERERTCSCPEGSHANVYVDIVKLAASVRIVDERADSFAVTEHLAIMHSENIVEQEDGNQFSVYTTSIVAAGTDYAPHPEYPMLNVARKLSNAEALEIAGAINA